MADELLKHIDSPKCEDRQELIGCEEISPVHRPSLVNDIVECSNSFLHRRGVV